MENCRVVNTRETCRRPLEDRCGNERLQRPDLDLDIEHSFPALTDNQQPPLLLRQTDVRSKKPNIPKNALRSVVSLLH